MNLETAENIQCEFEYLALDAYFPMHFASHGQGNKDWQFAVEFIYRLLICQLAILEPVNLETEKDILGFCHKLAKQNPFGKDNGVWYWGEIILTKKGLDLIIKYIPEAFEEWNGKKFELNKDQIIIFWILVLFWSAISIIRAYRKLYAITPIEQGGLSLTPVLAAQIAAGYGLMSLIVRLPMFLASDIFKRRKIFVQISLFLLIVTSFLKASNIFCSDPAVYLFLSVSSILNIKSPPFT